TVYAQNVFSGLTSSGMNTISGTAGAGKDHGSSRVVILSHSLSSCRIRIIPAAYIVVDNLYIRIVGLRALNVSPEIFLNRQGLVHSSNKADYIVLLRGNVSSNDSAQVSCLAGSEINSVHVVVCTLRQNILTDNGKCNIRILVGNSYYVILKIRSSDNQIRSGVSSLIHSLKVCLNI